MSGATLPAKKEKISSLAESGSQKRKAIKA
jgi:hypothetical protein